MTKYFGRLFSFYFEFCVFIILRCVACAGNDACKVCCKNNSDCSPLSSPAMENLQNGVPCIGSDGNNGTCNADVSENFVLYNMN